MVVVAADFVVAMGKRAHARAPQPAPVAKRGKHTTEAAAHRPPRQQPTVSLQSVEELLSWPTAVFLSLLGTPGMQSITQSDQDYALNRLRLEHLLDGDLSVSTDYSGKQTPEYVLQTIDRELRCQGAPFAAEALVVPPCL